jgi:hypothetical protein
MRTARIVASLTLAAYLTLAVAGAQGAVLCAGADGHVAIELHCEQGACSSGDASDATGSVTSCGDCVDFLLQGDAGCTRQDSGAQPVLVVQTTDTPASATAPVPASSQLLASSPQSPPISLRMTPLLI